MNITVEQKQPKFYNITGFGLIDSMVALVFLGFIILTIVQFNHSNNDKKEAKVLAMQTEIYAQTFAKYMNNNYDEIQQKLAKNSIVLNPQIIQASGKWPQNLSLKNIYGQTPCVAIVKNTNTSDLEAIMYYIGGRDLPINKTDIINHASVILGSKGGVLANEEIKGNSGWKINKGSEILNIATQCNGKLANNSLAVNIDLLSDWNQNLQPVVSIMRGPDPAKGGQETLPGHISNANTSKANIYLPEGKGVVFSNADPQQPIKLGMIYSGSSGGTGTPTIGLGDKKISTLVADTIQPDMIVKAGQACTKDEIGKTVVDLGTDSKANNVLARNTLVCTHNEMLCVNKDNTHTCYLPSISNQIIFKNYKEGIQDFQGKFICPSYAPFATNVITSNSSNKIDVYLAIGGYGDIRFNNLWCRVANEEWDCANYRSVTAMLFSTPLYVKNPLVPDMSIDNADIVSPGDYIVGKLNNYTVNIGYQLKTAPPVDTQKVFTNMLTKLGCNSLTNPLKVISFTDTKTGVNYDYIKGMPGAQSLRKDLNNIQCNSIGMMGLFAAFKSGVSAQSIIKQITCSNMPIYNAN